MGFENARYYPYPLKGVIWMKSAKAPLLRTRGVLFAPRENQRFSRGDPVCVSGRMGGVDAVIRPLLPLYAERRHLDEEQGRAATHGRVAYSSYVSGRDRGSDTAIRQMAAFSPR